MVAALSKQPPPHDLGHEYGHVPLHTWLYDKYAPAAKPHRCHRKDLLPTSSVVDWIEWHADYASGGLLMPETFLRRAGDAFFRERKEKPPVMKDSADATSLKDRVSRTFDVFLDAANVRLTQLGYLRD